MTSFTRDMRFTDRLKAVGVDIPKQNLTVAPNNGSVFYSGTGKMVFEISGSQLATYADFSSLYIAADITNLDNAAFTLTGIGTMGLISRIIVTTNGNKQICDIYNHNQLNYILACKQGDNNWLDSLGNAMFGTKSTMIAAGNNSFPANGTAGYIQRLLIPVNLIGISDMYFPLHSSENLRFEIYLESAITAVCSAGGITAAQISYSNILLHYDTMTLTQAQDEELINDFGGIFKVNVPCWQEQDGTFPYASLSTAFTLGFAKRYAKRLLIALRPAAATSVETVCSFTIDKAYLTEVSLKYNGKEVKSAPYYLPTSSAADPRIAPEILAESLKSGGGRILDIQPSNLKKGTYITDISTGVDDATTGRFYIEFDLENGFNDELQTVISGIPIVLGNFSLALKKSEATGVVDRTVYMYLEYWNNIILDFNTGSWTVEN